MAARLLQWHFQRQGEKAPEGTSLERMASDLVSKAHEVAKKRGQNVMVIIKELVEDLRR